MEELELINIIKKGESSTVQFKERVLKKNHSQATYDIATEIVAFLNAKGGMLIIGVNDKTGSIAGLNFKELQNSNELLSNVSSNNVRPPIYIITETVEIEGKNILLVNIPEGISKPHTDNKGIIWIKNGSDKRKVTSKEEMARLLQSTGNIYADEILVNGTTELDINENIFLDFFIRNWEESPEDIGITVKEAWQNTNVLKNQQLTLGGLLFFAKNPQQFRPAFCVKAVSFFGNEIENTEYRDSEDIKGTIPEMFEKGMAFLLRNLKKTQQGQNFNSTGILEVSKIALQELLQNALVHRDYFINAPIRLFIFDDRIEIISPGSLPNSLTIKNVKFGNTVIRNNLLTTFCAKIMKYRGIGSGIRRAIKEQPNIKFENYKAGELFKVTIPRSE